MKKLIFFAVAFLVNPLFFEGPLFVSTAKAERRSLLALQTPIDHGTLCDAALKSSKGQAQARPPITTIHFPSHMSNMRSGLTSSLGGHAAAFGLLFSLLGPAELAPPDPSDILLPNSYSLIWIPSDTQGAGGGGGGDSTPLSIPREMEVADDDTSEVAIAVPEPDPTFIEEPVVIPEEEVPEPEPEVRAESEVVTPPPLTAQQMVSIAAVSMAPSTVTSSGVLDGLRESLAAGPGQDGGGGVGAGGGVGEGDGSGLGAGRGGNTGGGVYLPGSAGVVSPRLLHEVTPQYTTAAMRAKIQGVVLLDVIVLPDGSVGPVRIRRSLDSTFGLDNQAIEAARQWRFQPGARYGEPVAVQVTLEMYFNLR